LPKISDYNKLGQSIWYDYLRRSFIASGELQSLVDSGLGGLTSNPTIFEAAIDGGTEYDEDMRRLFSENKPAEKIYETLMLDDIAKAADILRPIFEKTGGSDGFVSVEVSPRLGDDTVRMVEQARRFFYKLDRPNVMVKIPATRAGIPAVRTLISEGINVNITLMFSVHQYEAILESFMGGLEELASRGGDPRNVSSVASFFVSRVDTAVDEKLVELGDMTLQGQAGVANAKLAYSKFREAFASPRWKRLEARGARIQRPLWASTSTKNPAYPDTLYVDSLVGRNTINTIPPATLRAALDHGRLVEDAVERGLDAARKTISVLSDLGIDLADVADELEDEGIAKFTESLDKLLVSIERKRKMFAAGADRESASLGEFQGIVDSSLKALGASRILRRIWAHDFSVWGADPTEVSNRLDWLHAPDIMLDNLARFDGIRRDVRAAGYTRAVLLGMGGSSLASKVFGAVFGKHRPGGKDEPDRGAMELTVIDDIDPETILSVRDSLDLETTLFIVSSKSGGTIETLSLLKYFYGQALEKLGPKRAAEHFIVISDPESELASIADRYGFRSKILNDPNIGGRYSALSFDGLIPAALIGADLLTLLENASHAAAASESAIAPRYDPGAWLGVILGELAKRGKDKVTFAISPGISIFGDWLEQLIAESTGKDGKGILPVLSEHIGEPESYGKDRLFVRILLDGDELPPEDEKNLHRLEKAGNPVVTMRLSSTYELGRQMFIWEMAIAVAGHIIGINPFDQPNVESSKVSARSMISQYESTRKLPLPEPRLVSGEITVYGDGIGEDPGALLVDFLKQVRDGSYIAIQAFVSPSGATDRKLHELREALRRRFKAATTIGYGPRFLHSTGQLHKGDAGLGLFIQFIGADVHDVTIPDELGSPESSVSFGVLMRAQAFGDRQALIERRRKVITFDLKGDVPRALGRLKGGLDAISLRAT
jgi:transaldolase/glucose-6-phosphate isomerase